MLVWPFRGWDDTGECGVTWTQSQHLLGGGLLLGQHPGSIMGGTDGQGPAPTHPQDTPFSVSWALLRP